MNEELEILFEAADRFEKMGLAYMVTGSIAMAFYATPSLTRNIDIVINLSGADADDFCTAFEEDYILDKDAVRQSILQQSMFNIINQRTLIKIDLIIRKNEEYRLLEFARRKLIEIQGKSLWVVAPEDLILSKLCWAKASDSELQLRDVKLLLQSVDDLDSEYLRDWATKLGVDQLLERVTKDE